MERKLFWGIMTPGAVLTIVFGVWLWLGWFRPATGWLHAKIALVALLVGYHLWCWRLLRDFAAERNAQEPALVPLVQRVPDARAVRHGVPGCLQAVLNDFFATAPRGLEALLLQELASLGAQRRRQVPGGVAFSGDWEVCYRANLWSRIASRVLWKVAFLFLRQRGRMSTRRPKRSTGRSYFAVERTLRVNVTAQKSPLKSLEFATLRIKDAVCDRFRDAARQPSGRRPREPGRARPCLPGRGRRAPCTSTLPASRFSSAAGAPSRAEAPLRENLAAGIVMLTGWQPSEPLLDPMCGGGTLLVEAAAMARGRAPGAKRSFGFEKLCGVRCRRSGRSVKREKPERQAPNPRLFGSDNDPQRAQRRAAQPGRGGRRALGEARAAPTCWSAPRPRRRRHGGQSALRRAHRQRG